MLITMLFFIATEVLLSLLLLPQQQTTTTKTKTTNFTLPVSQDSSVLTQTTRTSKPMNNPPTSPQNQRSKQANKQTKSAERRGKRKEETYLFVNAQSTMAVLSMGEKGRRERHNPNLHDRSDTRSRVTARCTTLRACTAPQGSEKDEIPLGSLTSSLWPNSFQGRHLQIIFD